jgi:hypothetical protein
LSLRNSLFSLGLIGLWLSVPATGQDDDIFWFSDYKAALAEARKTGKPLFLEYRCEP